MNTHFNTDFPIDNHGTSAFNGHDIHKVFKINMYIYEYIYSLQLVFKYYT